MNDKNELSDIVLNKNTSSSSNKKIILAVATLGVVLIVVVMLMNSLSSETTDNLPQAVLPPEPQTSTHTTLESEPLFEEVEVIEDNAPLSSDEDLDKIAQKLKQESIKEETVTVKETPVVKQKHQTKPKQIQKVTHKTKQKHTPTKEAVTRDAYYIQVGSFSKYEPNKQFLRRITKLGFHYTYHKVNNLNKVLVGPFPTRKEAYRAKKVLRAKVEPGAFLVKL
jgi:DedD protein